MRHRSPEVTIIHLLRPWGRLSVTTPQMPLSRRIERHHRYIPTRLTLPARCGLSDIRTRVFPQPSNPQRVPICLKASIAMRTVLTTAIFSRHISCPTRSAIVIQQTTALHPNANSHQTLTAAGSLFGQKVLSTHIKTTAATA